VTRAESVKRMAREIRVAAQVKKIMREALELEGRFEVVGSKLNPQPTASRVTIIIIRR
jgi:hypothetical protein